jgi:hypothetical protein
MQAKMLSDQQVMLNDGLASSKRQINGPIAFCNIGVNSNWDSSSLLTIRPRARAKYPHKWFIYPIVATLGSI